MRASSCGCGSTKAGAVGILLRRKLSSSRAVPALIGNTSSRRRLL
jgi:hypothetical protein